MPQHCVVRFCDTIQSSSAGSGTSLHRFPKDPVLRSKWINFVQTGRKNWAPCVSSAICSLHFTSDDSLGVLMKKFGCRTRVFLKPGAIPTIQCPKMTLQTFQNSPTTQYVLSTEKPTEQWQDLVSRKAKNDNIVLPGRNPLDPKLFEGNSLLKTQNQINEEYDVGDTQNVQISKQTHRFSTHFVGGNGPTRDHPDPLPVRPMNVLHSSAGYIDAGPSNQVFSGKPENPRRKKIAAATVSSAPVLIPDDSPPQPSPAKIQKKQIDDRRFDEQRFQEQRFQERRFENRRFDDRRQMVNTQVSQMAAKTLQAQMPVQQHMSVAQVSQNITRPVQVLAPPIQISEPKPKPVEKPRPREKRIFVVADHQRCVMSNLASLWKSGKLCDAGIGNGSSTVMVHKVVLSAVCPKLLSVFSTDILSHKFLQVNFPEEVSTEALNAFAEYMYNGLLDIDPDILHQLKIIAKRLDMKEFEQLCDSRLPSTIPQQPASTVTVFGDLSQMQTILSNPPSITVPTVQPSLPSSSITSVTSQSAPSVTTQVIDVKQEISEAELAQVKKDTAAVFGQESEVASLDASKSGNSSGGFVIVPSVKTEPVGPEDDRYGQLNNQSYASTPVSISSRIPGTGLNSTVVSSSEFVLPFSDTTDSNTTNVLQGTSKLKSNVFESSLVSDLSPVSCIVEKMCSQSSPIREDPSKPLNRTITTQSIDNIVTSGSNEGVYPVGLFTAGGDSLPLSSTQVTNVKNIGLYKTDGLT
ncbi:uncharacterized protein LOC106877732 isoform X6 [Octopus bimaculoides]|uniref:uncharacterized protein LOC106877732 isoform X6 n=1 Tax=Octopus bimaculoides TaxID=37653 RepID=UPI0022E2F04C|nr:uncharacterized protein LOC106877732 isoform X6 [Octopus bimaculoides]